MPLLTFENAKTSKGRKLGFETAVLYMTPHLGPQDRANFCPWASKGCRLSCLYTAGRGAFSNVAAARLRRRTWFLSDPEGFTRALVREVEAHVRRSNRVGLRPVLRLNGTTDIDWHGIPGPDGAGVSLPQFLHGRHPELIFYNYSKDPRRPASTPDFETVAFSLHENNEGAALRLLSTGVRVAVVFDTKRGEPLPESWRGFPVVDGDEHDLIFLQPPGSVIGLRAKGRARTDSTGFVVRSNPPAVLRAA